jgi:hypothetical protein
MPIDFDRLTAPDYLAGLTERSLEDVRAMRAECQIVENALSLVRRVLHGRLDIVGAEIARRREGRDAASLAELVESLPTLLADVRRTGGNPRPPQAIDVSDVADQLLDELGPVVTATQLGALADLDDAEIAGRFETLELYELTVSGRRKTMHETIDALQAEITRRYRTGEATVDSLLS